MSHAQSDPGPTRSRPALTARVLGTLSDCSPLKGSMLPGTVGPDQSQGLLFNRRPREDRACPLVGSALYSLSSHGLCVQVLLLLPCFRLSQISSALSIRKSRIWSPPLSLCLSTAARSAALDPKGGQAALTQLAAHRGEQAGQFPGRAPRVDQSEQSSQSVVQGLSLIHI